MKNHFGQFISPHASRLGQTTADSNSGFYSTYVSPHIWWIMASAIISGVVSWKLCKMYTSGVLFDFLSSKHTAKKKLRKNPDVEEKVTNITKKKKKRHKRNPHQDEDLENIDFSELE